MLITAWNRAGWMEMPRRLGDRIGRLIGAAPGTVVMGDTLSIKVYQALASALELRPGAAGDPVGHRQLSLGPLHGRRAGAAPSDKATRCAPSPPRTVAEAIDDDRRGPDADRGRLPHRAAPRHGPR